MALFNARDGKIMKHMKYKLAKLNDANNSLDESWFVYYSYQHPETGKMFRFRRWISNRIKTKSGRRDKAHEMIREINSRLLQGWNPFAQSESRLTNAINAIDHAVKIKSAAVGKRSASTYKSIAKIFTSWITNQKLGHLSIGDINFHIVQRFFDNSLISESISPRTYNNRITALKTIFNFLVKREYIVLNPLNKVERIQEFEPEITAFTKAELRLISRDLPQWDYNLYVISNMIFYCFLRPAEIVRLQFRDLFWDHHLIIFPGTKTKNKKGRPVIIPDAMMENLKNWNRNFPGEWYLFSNRLKPGINQVAPTRIAEAWRRFADDHKIRKNIYDLKHTGNGMAFDLGINARDIQLQNRHHSLEQTQQYLNRFRKDPSDQLRKRFNGY